MQICEGIDYIHSIKIVHRDIKCSNIFLDADQNIKLGDFGISSILSTTNQFLNTFAGTYYYLSPEIIDNLPYNHKTDLWSLGVVLYELMVQKPPFTTFNNNRKLLELRIKRGEFTPPCNMYSSCLRNTVKLLLQKDPNKRISAKNIIRNNFIGSNKHVNNKKRSLLDKLNRNKNVLRSKIINSNPEINLQLKNHRNGLEDGKGQIQLNHEKFFKKKQIKQIGEDHAFNSHRHNGKVENLEKGKVSSSRKEDILNKINYLNKELDELDIDKPIVKYDLKKYIQEDQSHNFNSIQNIGIGEFLENFQEFKSDKKSFIMKDLSGQEKKDIVSGFVQEYMRPDDNRKSDEKLSIDFLFENSENQISAKEYLELIYF